MPHNALSDEEPPIYVRCAIADGVALVTLDRPDRLNAMGNEMGRQFDRVMVDIAQNEDVRAVVLTGRGRAFCAGADMERLSGFAESKGESAQLPIAGEPRGVFKALGGTAPPEVLTRYNSPQALPQPAIAAVNGPCVGVGLVLAAMCDVRFAAPEAFFLAPFASRGLVAESGVAQTLAVIAGAGVAADLLLSARRMPAAEAFRVGLVNHLTEGDVVGPALAYAQGIARNLSPRSLRVMKRQLWHARQQSFLQAADMAIDETRDAMRSEDFAEGVAHFVEKRPPRFTGR